MTLQKLADEHQHLWQDKPESYWFMRLTEEVGELGASLANDHGHTPDVELRQIATISMNWLRKFYPDIDEGEARADTILG